MNHAALKIQYRSRARLLLAFALLAGCATTQAPQPNAVTVPEKKPPAEVISGTPPAIVEPATPQQETPRPPASTLQKTSWNDLPGWRQDDPSEAWDALLKSCSVLAKQQSWREVCTAAAAIKSPARDAARRFFEENFVAYRISADDSTEGLITGYYEPLLRGSRKPSARYRFPLYGVPDDLLAFDLADFNAEMKQAPARGRIEGRRVIPYYDRAQIESGTAPVRGREIAWVDDAVELFFLQIQGSGRLQLENGEAMRVGFADHNGHPYRSIGRILIDRGELPLEKTSMQGIKAWARDNPVKLQELLQQNPRYVFFREQPGNLSGPLGALGVPLTAQRSVAIDPRFVPLGTPVFIATTWPNAAKPLNRLMLAQDTGGAIRGAVRADFFWGYGEDAAREAGRMKQPLRMWVLLPNGYPPPQ